VIASTEVSVYTDMVDHPWFICYNKVQYRDISGRLSNMLGKEAVH